MWVTLWGRFLCWNRVTPNPREAPFLESWLNPTLYWLQKYKQKLFVWQLEYLALYNQISRFLSKSRCSLTTYLFPTQSCWRSIGMRRATNRVEITFFGQYTLKCVYPKYVGKVIYFSIVNSLNKRNFILKSILRRKEYFEEEREVKSWFEVGEAHTSPQLSQKSPMQRPIHSQRQVLIFLSPDFLKKKSWKFAFWQDFSEISDAVKWVENVIFAGVHSQFQFPSSRNTAEEKRGYFNKFRYHSMKFYIKCAFQSILRSITNPLASAGGSSSCSPLPRWNLNIQF